MKPEKLRGQHELSNGLWLEIWDCSRPVAGDRWQVALEARINVPVNAANLPPELAPEESAVSKILGPEVVFRRREERNFISVEQVQEILEEMESRLLALATAYLGHQDFAPRIIRQKYAEALEKMAWQRT
jgi:hypothetical protein